ncbi:MAG: GTPase Era [Gammaproteobacteria bacterium]
MKLPDIPHCAVYAIIGRPNVGKSTLLNHLVGQKISITSRKPQTTRYRVNGIVQHGTTQLVFADTPGWQRQPQGRMHKLMNQQIEQAMQDIDGVLFVIDATQWRTEDEALAESVQQFKGSSFLVINKIDRLPRRDSLLPLIDDLTRRFAFDSVFPVCALQREDLAPLLDALAAQAPARPYLFDPDQVTDRPERFVAAELIREKLARQLGAELPYATHVAVERFEDREGITHIDAVIWVEKPGQKAIVIGVGGQRIKQIGSAARLDIERMLGRRVFLKTWVKVKGKWTEDPAAIGIFGASDGS